jgi:F-type H+-transporting ATPase subunit delta
MNESKISVRYAKALYDLAKEDKKHDAVKNDMDTVITCYRESEEFKNFIQSPVLKESVKINLLKSIFRGKVSDLSMSLFDLLVKNKRESYLPFIALNYLHFYKEDLGIKEAVLITAVPLDKNFRENFLKYLNKKLKTKIEMAEKVDTGIIGGFKLKIEDQQIDASIASHLNRIKKELINS